MIQGYLDQEHECHSWNACTKNYSEENSFKILKYLVPRLKFTSMSSQFVSHRILLIVEAVSRHWDKALVLLLHALIFLKQKYFQISWSAVSLFRDDNGTSSARQESLAKPEISKEAKFKQNVEK